MNTIQDNQELEENLGSSYPNEIDADGGMPRSRRPTPQFELVHPVVAEQEEELQKQTEQKMKEQQAIKEKRYGIYTLGIYILGIGLLAAYRYRPYLGF